MAGRIIWQQSYNHKWCVHIPWPVNKDVCLTLDVGIALIEDNGSFVLEVKANGLTKDINLANVCVPIPVGPFSVQVCIANLALTGGNVAFDLVVKACVDANIGPIHVNQCVNLVSQHIAVHLLAKTHLLAFGITEESTEGVYAYTLNELSEDAISKALLQPAPTM